MCMSYGQYWWNHNQPLPCHQNNEVPNATRMEAFLLEGDLPRESTSLIWPDVMYKNVNRVYEDGPAISDDGYTGRGNIYKRVAVLLPV